MAFDFEKLRAVSGKVNFGRPLYSNILTRISLTSFLWNVGKQYVAPDENAASYLCYSVCFSKI